MSPADARTRRRAGAAKLLAIDARGNIAHLARAAFPNVLRPGDLVIANDAATLPASLHGVHSQTGAPIEVRLAARPSLDAARVLRFDAVIFGAGDHRQRTEERPLPPPLEPGDELALGPLRATVERLLGHPRLAALRFAGSAETVWAGLARHGKPIQYAHVQQPLELWDMWTSYAALPVAFEPPSAGFALSWEALGAIRARGASFATLTHAAGISSTGDAALDARLPFAEPYDIPRATAEALRQTRWEGRRVIAVGTTVVRALDAATIRSGPDSGAVRAGAGIATQRIGPSTELRVVDALLSGVHEPGTSHYELLRAFTPDVVLRRADAELTAHGYSSHEFGDSVFIERCAAASVVRALIGGRTQGERLPH